MTNRRADAREEKRVTRMLGKISNIYRRERYMTNRRDNGGGKIAEHHTEDEQFSFMHDV